MLAFSVKSSVKSTSFGRSRPESCRCLCRIKVDLFYPMLVSESVFDRSTDFNVTLESRSIFNGKSVSESFGVVRSNTSSSCGVMGLGTFSGVMNSGGMSLAGSVVFDVADFLGSGYLGVLVRSGV